MGAPDFRDRYEFDPESYRGEAGLLGRLMSMMPPRQAQQTATLASRPNAAAVNPEPSFDAQGGLAGRLLALEAEQSRYRQIPLNAQADPFARADFRQLSGVPVWSQSAIEPSDVPKAQPDRTVSRSVAGFTVQPDRSMSDRLQAFWDRPAPYGLIAMLKAGTTGIMQSVQGSIDATRNPSTEEEAFQQNLGRELGPIGAFRAISLRTPLAPGGTSGFWRGISGLLVSRAASTTVGGINPLSSKGVMPQN